MNSRRSHIQSGNIRQGECETESPLLQWLKRRTAINIEPHSVEKLSKEHSEKIFDEVCAFFGLPSLLTDEGLTVVNEYLMEEYAPKRLAQIRRDNGDPTARPSDFCRVCGLGEDLSTRCRNKRPNCPRNRGPEFDIRKKIKNGWRYCGTPQTDAEWKKRKKVLQELTNEIWSALADVDVEMWGAVASHRRRRIEKFNRAKG